jgi:hypothetical protein
MPTEPQPTILQVCVDGAQTILRAIFRLYYDFVWHRKALRGTSVVSQI